MRSLKVILIFFLVLHCLKLGAAVSHLLHFTVDGLGGYYISGYLATNSETFPNFKRLQSEGAYTFNARCDYDYSETVPDHVTIITARPVLQPPGITNLVRHGYSATSSFVDKTISNYAAPTFYKASSMDVVHDNGLKVAILLGKTKLSVLTNSYNEANGAPDVIGEDNGRKKYDIAMIADTTPPLLGVLTNLLKTNAPNYVFFHFVEPDTVGHRSGWGSPEWRNAIAQIDGWLGQIFKIIDESPALSNNTAIVLTADHGGGGESATAHFDASKPLNYTIPIFVKGPGFEPGTDLYLYFGNRADPGDGRPDQAQPIQPLRNGDTSNIALMLLGLPPIPDSYWRPQYVGLNQSVAIEILKRGDNLLIRWQAQSGYLPIFADRLNGDWNPLTNNIQSDGTYNFVEISVSPEIESRFFRLRKN
ncbi:MAG: alkaline phosphatase family protein [Verrucomicrobiia bacterium]